MAKAAKLMEALPLDSFHDHVENPKGSPGVTIEDRRNHAIIQVFAKNGKVKTVERALKIKETPGRSTVNKDYTALPLSPGQWILISAKQDNDFAKKIGKKLGNSGYVSEQSDSRVILRVSGKNARDVMQKGCRLDLHPLVAGAGFCGQTQMAQVGVVIHQTDNKPTYDLMVFSGFAQDFADWLLHSAAEFGVRFSKSR